MYFESILFTLSVLFGMKVEELRTSGVANIDPENEDVRTLLTIWAYQCLWEERKDVKAFFQETFSAWLPEYLETGAMYRRVET